MQNKVIIKVATVNRIARKAIGGTSRKPILLKTKLPPQNSVVRMRKKWTFIGETTAAELLLIAGLKTVRKVKATKKLLLFIPDS
jgi:hypothetical protein